MSYQSVLLSKNSFNKREASRWVLDNGYKILKLPDGTQKIDVTANYYRYRQTAPDSDKYDYRIEQITNGVLGVRQYPKFRASARRRRGR